MALERRRARRRRRRTVGGGGVDGGGDGGGGDGGELHQGLAHTEKAILWQGQRAAVWGDKGA